VTRRAAAVIVPSSMPNGRGAVPDVVLHGAAAFRRQQDDFDRPIHEQWKGGLRNNTNDLNVATTMSVCQ